MSKEQAGICVIIPVYNRAKGLERALMSLVNQTYKDFEVRVCDDGSTEDIQSVCERFKDDLSITYLYINHSGGPAIPRNTAAHDYRGKWLSFLDSDDWWYPDRLEIASKYFSDSVDVLYHSMAVVTEHRAQNKPRVYGKKIGSEISKINPLRSLIWKGNTVPLSSAIVRRTILEAVGGFNSSIIPAGFEDYYVWITMAMIGARFEYIPFTLGCYCLGGDNLSKRSAKFYQDYKHFFGLVSSRLRNELNVDWHCHFCYRLGAEALALGDAIEADHIFAEIKLSEEPKLWLKSKIRRVISRVVGLRMPKKCKNI